MDGDGADDPAAMPALVAPISIGAYDFVIGSRARGEREPGSMAWHQLLAGRVAGFLTWLLYGVRYTDMCGYRAIRRDTLLVLGMRELTYGWNLEMQMRVAAARLRIRELPVDHRCRRGGVSKVSGNLFAGLRPAGRAAPARIRPRGLAAAQRLMSREGGRFPAPGRRIRILDIRLQNPEPALVEPGRERLTTAPRGEEIGNDRAYPFG